MSNNIAVSVTADVADLVAKRAIISSELKQATKDLNDFARTARDSGSGLTPGMLAAADGVAKSKAQIALLDTQMRSLKTSTDAETVAMRANTSAHVSGTAAREGLVLVHEALSGNFHRMAGSIMIEAQAMMGAERTATVMSAALNPLTVGVVATTAAFGFLAVKEYEAIKASQAAAEAFALTGRGANMTAEAVRGEIDRLADMQGSSRSVAQALVEFDAAHGSVNLQIAYAANQLAPQFIQAWGDKAPEALNSLKEALSEMAHGSLDEAVRSFQRLNESTLNLKPAEAEFIEGMIQAGNTIGAVNRIIADLAAQGGGHIESLNQAVAETKQKLADAEAQATAMRESMKMATDPEGMRAFATAAAQADDKVRNLRASLIQLQAAAQEPISGQALEDAVNRSHATLMGLRDGATKAKDALTELHAEMDQRRKANPNDPEVKNYYANQKSIDERLSKKEDPAAFKKPKTTPGMGAESPLTAMENDLRQSEFSIRQSTGSWQADMSAMEAKFWKDKLDKAKEGTKLYGDIQARYQEALSRSGTRSASQNRQMSNSDIETDLHIAQTRAKGQEQAAGTGFEERLRDPTQGISADDKYQAMKAAAEQEAAAELQAQEQKKALYADDVAAVAEAANKEKEINTDLAEKLTELERQRTADVQRESEARVRAEQEAAKKKEEAWRAVDQGIYAAENQLINGIISGRQSMGQILANLASQLVEHEIQADVRALTAKRLAAAQGTVLDQKEAQGGLLIHLLTKQREVASTVSSEAAKTVAVTAGGQARVAATATSSAQSAAIVGAHNLKEITSHAATAAAAAYHAMAGIPVVGPVLGAAAAAATFAVVEGYGALASFAKGTNSLPTDMIAQVHAGERIVPAADNAKLLAAVDRGTSGGAERAGDMHVHYNPTVNGHVPFADQLAAHEDNIFSMMKKFHRSGRFR